MQRPPAHLGRSYGLAFAGRATAHLLGRGVRLLPPVTPNPAGCRLRVRLAVFPVDLAHAHRAAGTGPCYLVGRARWQSLTHVVAQCLESPPVARGLRRPAGEPAAARDAGSRHRAVARVDAIARLDVPRPAPAPAAAHVDGAPRCRDS